MSKLRGHELVRHLLRDKGWTLQQLHERTCDEYGQRGITVPDLSRIQNGKLVIGPERAFKLGRAFNRSPQCFVTKF